MESQNVFQKKSRFLATLGLTIPAKPLQPPHGSWCCSIKALCSCSLAFKAAAPWAQASCRVFNSSSFSSNSRWTELKRFFKDVTLEDGWWIWMEMLGWRFGWLRFNWFVSKYALSWDILDTCGTFRWHQVNCPTPGLKTTTQYGHWLTDVPGSFPFRCAMICWHFSGFFSGLTPHTNKEHTNHQPSTAPANQCVWPPPAAPPGLRGWIGNKMEKQLYKQLQQG